MTHPRSMLFSPLILANLLLETRRKRKVNKNKTMPNLERNKISLPMSLPITNPSIHAYAAKETISQKNSHIAMMWTIYSKGTPHLQPSWLIPSQIKQTKSTIKIILPPRIALTCLCVRNISESLLGLEITHNQKGVPQNLPSRNLLHLRLVLSILRDQRHKL